MQGQKDALEFFRARPLSSVHRGRIVLVYQKYLSFLSPTKTKLKSCKKTVLLWLVPLTDPGIREAETI